MSFAHREDWILRGLPLTVPTGDITTLTGAPGGGKTTVVDLIIGLLRPQAGEVLIDGIPLAELDILLRGGPADTLPGDAAAGGLRT